MKKRHAREDLFNSREYLSLELSTRYFGKPLILRESVNSTNTVCFEEFECGASHGTAVVADVQKAGRGRNGRTWHSPPRKNLYTSILLTRLPQYSAISWIPLVTGLALSDTLTKFSSLTISLKWPNDILFKNKKMAGILCESKQKGKEGPVCVVGVGVNINCTNGDFPPEFSELATSLFMECQTQFNRSVILSDFLTNFESYYNLLLESDTNGIKSLYRQRCATLTQNIRVDLMTGKSIQGFAVDVGDDGELLVAEHERSAKSIVHKIREGDVIHVR